jgi:UDP-N-acetylmuramoyl-L-alanyl-D-glutamate--2,6-diaminopimelate ligase
VTPLRSLVEALAVRAIHGDPAVPIGSVVSDSRSAGPGALFVALHGTRADGAAFIDDAIARGAAAVVADRPVSPERMGKVVWIQVDEPAVALALLAAAFHGRPADRFVRLGVTGTNGKTTTTYLLEAALRAAGFRPGVIGTIEVRFPGTAEPSRLTTPDPVALHGWFARMAEAKVDHLVMEVSSHGLVQKRVAGLRFHAAAFTNLSHDHLDFHPSFEAYAEAKLLLFREHLEPGATAVVCEDDPFGERVRAAAAGRKVIGFSTRPGGPADLAVESATYRASGTTATLRCLGSRVEIESPLIGEHNLSNLLAAVGLGIAAGLDPTAAAEGAASLRSVPGRLERADLPNGAHAFVDYSHTPDALERAIRTLRAVGEGRLWVIFGCGGDRDRQKRPVMGRAAAAADRVVLTSDNPRSENPETILDEVEPGLREAGLDRVAIGALAQTGRGYARETDRRTAIRETVQRLASGDVLLVAGKGHENYQIVGTERRHFDDREEVLRAAAS